MRCENLPRLSVVIGVWVGEKRLSVTEAGRKCWVDVERISHGMNLSIQFSSVIKNLELLEAGLYLEPSVFVANPYNIGSGADDGTIFWMQNLSGILVEFTAFSFPNLLGD